MLLASGWANPERSLAKAAQVVRSYAGELASAQGQRELFVQVMTAMGRVIQRLARMNKRKKVPSTAQRLLAFAGSPK